MLAQSAIAFWKLIQKATVHSLFRENNLICTSENFWVGFSFICGRANPELLIHFFRDMVSCTEVAKLGKRQNCQVVSRRWYIAKNEFSQCIYFKVKSHPSSELLFSLPCHSLLPESEHFSPLTESSKVPWTHIFLTCFGQKRWVFTMWATQLNTVKLFK